MFKESLRNKYEGYWIGKNNIKASKRAIIEWIDELWYLDSVIANEMIFNSFKYSEVNSSLDGDEGDKFRGYGDIIKEMRLFKLNLMMSYI